MPRLVVVLAVLKRPASLLPRRGRRRPLGLLLGKLAFLDQPLVVALHIRFLRYSQLAEER